MLVNGDTVGPYVIEAPLGAGGFGEVYVAREPSPNRLVALKLVLPKVADHPLFLRRFQHEVDLMAKVEHQNVVPIYRHDVDRGRHYFTMRYVAGGSLADLLRASLDGEDVLAVLDGVADGLDACRAQNVVHRDVKPANILIDTATGRGLLSDFGIAYSPELSTLTSPGSWIGTEYFLAPEVLLGTRATADADLWSLGAVAYRALTGTHPRGRGVPATATIVPPSFHASELSPAVDRAVMRALAFVPEHRYRSARAFVDELREAMSRPHSAPGHTLRTPIYDTTSSTMALEDPPPAISTRRIVAVAVALFAVTPALVYALNTFIN